MANENKQPLATVNGKDIFADDLNNLVSMLPPQQQMQFQSREARRSLLNELIAQELFLQDALDTELDKTEEFQALLEDTKEKLLKSTAINNFMNSIEVADEEVKDFYDNNPDQFIAPESVRASHILVDSEGLAKDIIKEIDDGLSFEEAAQKYSTCPSAQAGGDLNYFQRGQMVPEFEQAAFSLEPGQMTEEPVQTQFGYHIIKSTDHREPETIPYDIVKDSAKAFLLAQKQEDAFNKHLDELKEKYPVEINLGMI